MNVKTNANARSVWMWLGLIAVLLAAGGWLAQRLYAQGGVSAVLAGQGAWSLMGAAKDVPTSDGAAAPAMRSLDAVRKVVLQSGVLQGTQPAGDWAVGPDGKLHPSNSLRKRFEYYLLALGDATPQELRALIQDEARAAHGDQLTAAILDVFDKYWALRNHAPRYRLDLNDRSTWDPAFAEQKELRRQYLGAEWAEAFFKDEEDYFVQQQALVENKPGSEKFKDPGLPVPQQVAGKDPAAVRAERVALYGEDAAKRLDQADAEWADWEKRLAAAKAEWQRLSSAPELSGPQRKQAIDQYVQEHFKADELLRVRALLNLPA